MNWKLILILSLFGVAMAFITVLLPSVAEPFCWLAVFVLSAWQIAKDAPQKPFLNGFTLNLINAVWVTTVRVLLLPAYLSHHAKEAAQYAKVDREVGLTPVM